MRYHVRKCLAVFLLMLIMLTAMSAGVFADDVGEKQVITGQGGLFSVAKMLGSRVRGANTTEDINISVGSATLYTQQDATKNRILQTTNGAEITVKIGTPIGAAIDPYEGGRVVYPLANHKGLFIIPDGNKPLFKDWDEVAYLKVHENGGVTFHDMNNNTKIGVEVVLITDTQNENMASVTVGEVAVEVSIDQTENPTATTTAFTEKSATSVLSSYEQPGTVIELKTLISTLKAGEKLWVLKKSNNGELVVSDTGHPNTPTCEHVKVVKEVDEQTGVSSLTLKPCKVGGELLAGDLYKEIDRLYNFTIKAQEVSQEQAKDDGRVWLWRGTKYFDKNITREGIDYTKTYPGFILGKGLQDVDYARDDGEKPYDPNGCNTRPDVKRGNINTSITITGRDGDIITPSKLNESQENDFPLDCLYASNTGFVTSGEKAWVRLGHNIRRLFWITDYLELNAREDNIEYFEIVDNNGTGKLEAVCGNSDSFTVGEKSIYIPTEGKVPVRLISNDGELRHVNIRVNGNVSQQIETTDGQKVMGSGTFEVLGGNGNSKMTIIYKGNTINRKVWNPFNWSNIPFGQAKLENGYPYEYEPKKPGASNFTIPVEDGTDVDLVTLTLDLKIKGQLKDPDGNVLEGYDYTEEKPLSKIIELDSPQKLAAAIQACPNRLGYDIIINIEDILVTDPTDTKSVQLIKYWNDANDIYQKRPNAVDVTLKRRIGGVDDTWEETYTISKDSNDAKNYWSLDVTGLDKYDANDIPYEYFIASENLDAETPDTSLYYTSDISGLTVTNTLISSSTTSVTVRKTWEDYGDKVYRPQTSVKVQLYRNNVPIGTPQKLDSDGYVFTNLPMLNNTTDRPYIYRVEETDVIPGYYAVYSEPAYEYSNQTLNITNVLKTEITVNKVWNDDNNRDNKRPTGLKVEVLANGTPVGGPDGSYTLTASDSVPNDPNTWTHTFDRLPKYDSGGNVITYTVREDTNWSMNGYSVQIAPDSIIPTAGNSNYQFSVTLTNSRPTDMVTITGVKTWDERGNPPVHHDDPAVKLLADGVAVMDANTGDYLRPRWNGDAATGGRRYTFPARPKNKQGKIGEPIVYTVQEEEVEGYTTNITGYDITNTLITEVTVSGVKTWVDNDNPNRPASITVYLMNGTDKVDEAIVKEEENWTYTFDNLPKFDADGLIRYKVVEQEIDGYTPVVNGYNITNMLNDYNYTINHVELGNETNVLAEPTAGKAALEDVIDVSAAQKKITGYTYNSVSAATIEIAKREKEATIYYTRDYKSLTVNKLWVDETTASDNITPVISITVTGSDGSTRTQTEGLINGVTATADGADGGEVVFTDLPVVDEKGKLIDYTVSEAAVTGTLAAYNASYSANKVTLEGEGQSADKRITITNTRRMAQTGEGGNPGDITVVKEWHDEIDTSMRDSVTLILRADGTEVDRYSFDIDEYKNTGSRWTYTFRDMPEFAADGRKYEYTADEDAVPVGYIKYKGRTPLTVENWLDTISFYGRKTWSDIENNKHEEDTVVLELRRSLPSAPNNWETLKSISVTADSSDEEGNWWFWFDESYVKYDKESGEEWTYRVFEANGPADYTPTGGGVVSIDGQEHNVEIHNVYTPPVPPAEPTTVTVSGQKIWNDAGYESLRPATVTVVLYGDGGVEVGRTTASAQNDWAYQFANLPQTNEIGEIINYTVAEDTVPEGYTASVNGWNITNTFIPPTTYTLTVNYWYDAIAGAVAAPTVVNTYNYNDYYNVLSPAITGFNVSLERVTGYITADTIVDVIYTAIPPDDPDNNYTLTINYVYAATGATAAPRYRETGMLAGDTYNVTSPTIAGYNVTQTVVSGTMPARNVTITVYYSTAGGAESIDLIDYAVPLGLGTVTANIGDCFE